MLAASLSFLPVFAANMELRDVLERTAVTPPARVSFTEERHNEMFANPLVLTGYLEYLEDGELRKIVETPFEERFYIKSDRFLK